MLFFLPPPLPSQVLGASHGVVSATKHKPLTKCIYIARCPVVTTGQCDLPFTPRQTCSIESYLDSSGKFSVMPQLMHKTTCTINVINTLFQTCSVECHLDWSGKQSDMLKLSHKTSYMIIVIYVLLQTCSIKYRVD